jgi:hypothetical protein
MKYRFTSRPLVAALVLGTALSAFSQSLPEKQPNLITSYRESVKPGQSAAHIKHEAGWPAAYAKANFPYAYLAMTSITGPPEAWFVATYDSHAAIGDGMKRESSDPALAKELDRLALEDSKYIDSMAIIQARARPELSVGEFPDMVSMRFIQVTVIQIRPGQETAFEDSVKAYGAARKRADAKASFRFYQVLAGMPGPSYLVFMSVTDFAEFDQVLAADAAARKGATPEETAAMQKGRTEAFAKYEVNRYRIEPTMSYVSKETRAKDPAFWSRSAK